MERAMRNWSIAGALVVGVLALLVLIIGAAASTGFLPFGCACTSPVSEAPWPISEASAIATAGGYLTEGGIGIASDRPTGQRLYILTSAEGLVIVDGETAAALEAAWWAAMPTSTARTIPADAAADTARAFLSAHSIDPGPLTATVETDGAAAGMEVVAWSDAGRRQIVVSVNGETGAIASFVDLRGGANLIAPVITGEAAGPRALAAIDVAGEQVLSTEFLVTFDATGAQRSVWSIGVGVPSPTEANVYLNGALVEVDAVSGQTTVVKS